MQDKLVFVRARDVLGERSASWSKPSDATGEQLSGEQVCRQWPRGCGPTASTRGAGTGAHGVSKADRVAEDT